MKHIDLEQATNEPRNCLGKPQLIDSHGRKISYLRVSVTDRCNLNCFYCRPNNIFEVLSHKDVLSYEEIYRLIGIAARLGIQKVRITGGEPFVRRDVAAFAIELKKIKGIKDVSLTTNGIYLKQHLENLYSGGIRRINISLDTLIRERFQKITGADRFHDVYESILLAEKLNFNPIKINMVVIKGINDDEVRNMAQLTKFHPFHIRFIEYMPVGFRKDQTINYFVPTEAIKQEVQKIGILYPVPSQSLDGPAKMYQFKGALGKVGFISAISNHFCETCNRLRLTAGGRLKPCLLSNRFLDIKDTLRSGGSDSELADILINAVNMKPMQHQVNSKANTCVFEQMSNIGG